MLNIAVLSARIMKKEGKMKMKDVVELLMELGTPGKEKKLTIENVVEGGRFIALGLKSILGRTTPRTITRSAAAEKGRRTL